MSKLLSQLKTYHKLPIAHQRYSIRRTNHYFKKTVKQWPIMVGLTSTKAGLADLFTQVYIEGNQELNYTRLFAWFSFGSIYSGTLCHFLYTYLYPTFLPNTIFKLVLINNFINTPFIFFPVLYTIKYVVLDQTNFNLFQDCLLSWKIWVPVDIITFTIIPLYFRLPFSTMVSFLYYCVISFEK